MVVGLAGEGSELGLRFIYVEELGSLHLRVFFLHESFLI